MIVNDGFRDNHVAVARGEFCLCRGHQFELLVPDVIAMVGGEEFAVAIVDAGESDIVLSFEVYFEKFSNSIIDSVNLLIRFENVVDNSCCKPYLQKKYKSFFYYLFVIHDNIRGFDSFVILLIIMI